MDLTWGRVGRRNGAKSSGSGGPSSSGGGHRLALRSNQNGGARNGTNGAAEHQAGPRQSGASDSPQNGSSQKTYKISASDIQMVQNLIERCLQLHLNQKEVIHTLQQHSKIEPSFTALVWQKLEEQNPEFFKVYYTRLRLKDQIMHFNVLLEQHSMQVNAFGGGVGVQAGGTSSFPFMATPGNGRDTFGVGVNELFPDQPGIAPPYTQRGAAHARASVGKADASFGAGIPHLGNSVSMFTESHDALVDELAHFGNGFVAGTLSLSDLTADLTTHIADGNASLPMVSDLNFSTLDGADTAPPFAGAANGAHADPAKDDIMNGSESKGKLPYTFSLSDMNLAAHLDDPSRPSLP